MSAGGASLTEQFLELFLQHQQDTHAFIGSLVGNRADADDLMQKTSLVLWRRFGEFQRGSNFLAWACQIARFQVQNYYRGKRREPVVFSQSLIELLTDDHVELCEEWAPRREALAHCRTRLRPAERDLLDRCYSSSKTRITEVAAALGRSGNSVYRSLTRIRRALMECIERTMRREEGL